MKYKKEVTNMAITLNGSRANYMGLSTDTKPTEGVYINTIFLELDTGDFYYFDGENWQIIGG